MCEISDTWKEVVVDIKKAFYRCPLGRKRQRVTQRKQRDGKVHVYSAEEIHNYVQMMNKDHMA